MPKINKPTDMTSVTIEDINAALTRIYAALQGRIDEDNLLESNNKRVGIPSEKVLDYPVPTKPIYGDKFLVAKLLAPEEGWTAINGLFEVMEDNRNYTILSASKTFNFYEGSATTGTSDIRTTDPQIFKGKRRYTTSYVAPSQSDLYISIPKSPEVKAIVSEKLMPTGKLEKKIMYTQYVRIASNLENTTTWNVSLSEPVETAEEIRFNVNIDSAMSVDAWADAGSHADFFIDVDVLCEVLV